jgi:hypothetical protein
MDIETPTMSSSQNLQQNSQQQQSNNPLHMLGNSLQNQQIHGNQQMPANYQMNPQFHPQHNNGIFTNFVMNQLSNNAPYNPYQQYPQQYIPHNPYGYNYPPPPPPGNSGW